MAIRRSAALTLLVKGCNSMDGRFDVPFMASPEPTEPHHCNDEAGVEKVSRAQYGIPRDCTTNTVF
jgi:hypothetical protein